MTTIAHSRRLTWALWVAIFCNTMSFFGYVYEQIVFVPNMFSSSPTESKMLWTNYYTSTNPGHYHILVTVLALIAFIVLWIYRQGLGAQQSKRLKAATIMFVIANILTGIAVTQINNKLYFGGPINEAQVVLSLATSWALLNLMRAIAVFICIVSLLKIFQITLNSPQPEQPQANLTI